MHLTVTVTPGDSTDNSSDNDVIHINGGSSNPNGYDIQNGAIVSIGDNVQIWLTPDSPDGAIKGDHVPECSDPSQIHYYDSNGNVNGSSAGHTDIFVVGDHTGGYYQQGDWSNDHYDFRPVNNITGNQGVPEGEAGKDYIFVNGDSSNYNVTGVDHPDNHQNNSVDNVQITNTGNGSHPIGNANGIEGIVFGNGPSSSLGGSTDVTHSVTLNVDVDLQSSDSSDHLNSITINGLPEGAQFGGEYTSVTYDAEHGSYTLTFDDSTTHYDGQVTVTLPEGESHLGEIAIDVGSTASDQIEHDFTFNGEEGGQLTSGTESASADTLHPVSESVALDDVTHDDAHAVTTDDSGTTASDNASAVTADDADTTATDNASAATADDAGTTASDNTSAVTADDAGTTASDNASAVTADDAGTTASDNASAVTADDAGTTASDNASAVTADDAGTTASDNASAVTADDAGTTTVEETANVTTAAQPDTAATADSSAQAASAADVTATRIEAVDVHLTVGVTPGSQSEEASDNNVMHVNGGSEDPNGYDVQNGVIIAIGDNVQIWLTPDSPDGAIKGDQVPEHSNPDQIHYYDSHGNVNGSSAGHTDIFVVGDHTGGYYQQGDWSNDHYDFRPVHNISGNQGTAGGSAGKDYIFVNGDSANYNVTGVDHTANHQNNAFDNLQITNTENGSHPIGHANGIEGVIFGDGPSSSMGGSTEVTHSVTLNVDVDLESSDSSDHLTSLTLNGLPEGAHFSGEYTDVSYDGDKGSYTLTFDDHATHYEGQISVELPEGQHNLGDISMEVNSTASEHHDTDFNFNGEEGGQFVSGTDTTGSDDHPTDDTADSAHIEATSAAVDDLSHADAGDTHADSNDTHTDTGDTPADTEDTHADAGDTHADAGDMHADAETAADTDTTAADDNASAPLLIDSSEISLDFGGSEEAEAHGDQSLATTDTGSLNNLLGDDGAHAENDTDGTAAHATQPDNSSASGDGSDSASHDSSDSASPGLDQDQPINFSDIILDGDEHQDLASLIQGDSTPATPVDPAEDTDHPAPVAPPGEGGDDAGSGDGGGHDDMDNLIAKPDSDGG
ncbi:hypothetical protein [Kosakonia radicincitans]|uniref:hypothetical protein n=1 Tax=Kosakonia radicincitans TaxID=283686 RepID=UPI001269964E|nr:hypothetical protein [Kosakonia radicincitans]